MKPYDILLVEDAPDILERNRAALAGQGYTVHTAATVEQARIILRDVSPHLLVLDVMLPDGSGLDLCRELRDKTSASILFLTALSDSDQIVGGLRAGGDDYITKPYRIEELLARVEAQLRRTERLRQDAGRVFGPLRLDAVAQRAYLEGRDLLLSPKEYQILALLMQRPEVHRPAVEIFGEVWGMDANQDVRTVRVHISHLRGKLRKENEECPVRIEHSETKGYRITRNGGEWL